MIEVHVDVNTDSLTKLRVFADPKGKSAKAVYLAMNSAITQGMTLAKKEITKKYTIPRKDVEELSEIRKARRDKLDAYLKFGSDNVKGKKPKGRMLTTAHFSVSPVTPTAPKGVSIANRSRHTLSVLRGRTEQMKHVFIVNKTGFAPILWHRTKEKIVAKKGVRKGKIINQFLPVKGISIAQMANAEIRDKVQEKMIQVYNKRFAIVYERELLKAMGATKK